jgi:PRTRC genetic system ThiF family protein
MTRKKKTSISKADSGAKPKSYVHYTDGYIVDPAHAVTVNVIGCGGTGSQVLSSLARMHSALVHLGHPGFFVRAIDPDKVTVANMGRQLFSSSDVDNYKSIVLISRINRFFGTDWEAHTELYNEKTTIPDGNITISCVDTGAARKVIKNVLLSSAGTRKREKNPWGLAHVEPYEQPIYWMDFGNMADRGQVVISTVKMVHQPAKSEFSCRTQLATIDDLHPDVFIDSPDDDQGPSCSLAEALSKQDLFINTNLANMGMAILWKMFRELRIQYHGCYLNLANLQVTPIPIR